MWVVYFMEKFIKILKTIALNYDKRQQSKVRHGMEEILLIVIIGKMAKMEDLLACLYFAQNKYVFFKQWLPFEYGLPSKNTIYRVMETIDKNEMQMLFGLLLCKVKKEESIYKNYNDHIAIDGKTIKGSKRYRNKNNKKHNSLHILNAYSIKEEVPIASKTLKSKENEITTLPKVIDSLSLEDKIVTIDAIGTQQKVIDSILRKKGSFLLPVKENQKYLFFDLSTFFSDKYNINTMKKLEDCYFISYEKEHSFIETRECFFTTNTSWISEPQKWNFVKGIGCIKYKTLLNIKTKPKVFTRYFICSDDLDVKTFANIVRNHWKVETMHWHLDVLYQQDHSSISNYSSVENYDILCKFVYSLIKKSKKVIDNSISFKNFLVKVSTNLEFYIPLIFDSI